MERINWGQKVETKNGHPVHFIGIGVCGQPVIQIRTEYNNDDSWRLFRVEGDLAISLGKSDFRYFLVNTSRWDGKEHN